MKKDALSSLRLFTVFFLAAMFLPRLVPQGLFGDGLLYASLARNLAEGKGSMWAPWFSSGYWLDFASGAPYFENPPLMIWLEAVFFRIIGDYWWVEKLYSLLLFVINAWLIVRIWEIPLRGTDFQGKYGWFPLLLWYLTTPAVWGNPNNMMDNNLLTFCLLGLYFALDGLFSGKNLRWKLTLAGVSVYLGLMTKGPVGLYPVATPFLFMLTATLPAIRKADIAKGALRSAWVGLVALGLFALMLALVPESRVYFENYWQKRLGVVLSGVREDAELTGLARLSIFRILAKEMAVLIAAFFILFFISRRKKINAGPFRHERRTGLLFLLLGFAATLPIMLSARQNGIYIIPAMPVFALAAGYWHLPLLHHWLAPSPGKTTRFFEKLRWLSIAGLIVLSAYVVFLFGKPGRDRALLHDLPMIRQAIPKGEKVLVCEKLMYDQQLHTYLQRFHHLELTRDTSACRFALADKNCVPDITSYGFVPVNRAEDTYMVFRKP